MRKTATILGAAIFAASAGLAEVRLDVVYLKIEQDLPPVLSNLDPIPPNLGVAGAEVGLQDNTTTGRFLGHSFGFETNHVPQGADPTGAARQALSKTAFLIIDGSADNVMAIADLPEAKGAILFNVASGDNGLREENCRANLLHTLPSDSMRTDALAQFLATRRWDRLAMVSGTHPRDLAFAQALRTSLTKFGLGLRSEKTWTFDADMRRNAAQEVPLFTQGLKDHDVLLIADEIHDFGRYIVYNTWEPRPVAGSEGLTAQAWSEVVEQWGAAQLQSRFEDHAGRSMRSEDYAAWAAMRSLGEAVTRTNSAETETVRNYILGTDFELAGFKGRALSFRPWNGQLRQPIALVHPRAMVAMAPLEGFLHPVSALDTLGRDAPESNCKAFGNR